MPGDISWEILWDYLRDVPGVTEGTSWIISWGDPHVFPLDVHPMGHG